MRRSARKLRAFCFLPPGREAPPELPKNSVASGKNLPGDAPGLAVCEKQGFLHARRVFGYKKLFAEF